MGIRFSGKCDVMPVKTYHPLKSPARSCVFNHVANVIVNANHGITAFQPQQNGTPITRLTCFVSIVTYFVQRTAWKSPEAVSLKPAIWPRSLIASALLKFRPKVPRSAMIPPCQRKACNSPVEVPLAPTTCPWLLIALAVLPIEGPPSAPRSVSTPFCQRKARDSPEPIVFEPTTCPRSLMPRALL